MKSPRKKLKDKIGALHFQVLKLVRNNPNTCEICGGKVEHLTRFHILTVGAHPRMEFVDENILLCGQSHWYKCHEPYHRDRDSTLGRRIMERIVELRGKDYIDKLLTIEKTIDRHSMFYLEALYFYLKERLKKLGKVKNNS